MFNFLYFLYDILVPRFVTEWCIMDVVEDGEDGAICDPVMPLSFYNEDVDDEPEYVAEVSSFTWLGFAVFPKIINNDVYLWEDVKEHLLNG